MNNVVILGTVNENSIREVPSEFEGVKKAVAVLTVDSEYSRGKEPIKRKDSIAVSFYGVLAKAILNNNFDGSLMCVKCAMSTGGINIQLNTMRVELIASTFSVISKK